MRYDSFSLRARDACVLQGHRWLPEREPRALLQIAHDVAEHGGLYAYLAERLCEAGYGVYALDLRGHGQSVEASLPGHFADSGGWCKVVDDQLSLNHLIRRQFPLVSSVLLGHSMGSYIALAYLLRYSCSVDAAILSGSRYQPLWRSRLARLVVRVESWRLGPLGRSALVERLVFGSFARLLRPVHTPFGWSSPAPQADTYLAAPYCGCCTNQLWLDLLEGLQEITPHQSLARIDAALPLLLIGGADDPLGSGQHLHQLYRALRAAGLSNVELKLYPEARHALLDERNRDEVIGDLLAWLAQLPTRRHYCPL